MLPSFPGNILGNIVISIYMPSARYHQSLVRRYIHYNNSHQVDDDESEIKNVR